AGHRDDAVMRLPGDRAFGPHVVEIRMRIGNQRGIGEVVDGIEISGHDCRFLPGGTRNRGALDRRTFGQSAEHLLSTELESGSRTVCGAALTITVVYPDQ